MELHPKAYQGIIENLNDGLYFVDRKRVITFWNRGAERITGYSSQEVVGRSCGDNILNHVDAEGTNLCLSICPLAKSIRDGEERVAEVFLHHKDGHRVPVLVRTAVLRDDQGEVIGGIELFTDISNYVANQQRVEELERLSQLDHLTQLANRGYLEAQLESHLDELRRFGRPFGLLFIDIDNFKEINDSLGHGQGDQVLGLVARTITASTRPFDTFGRWGGEEFLGIIRGVNLQELSALGGRLRTLIQESYLLSGDQKLGVTVSIGATLAIEGDTVESLIDRADQLMYNSKESGRNTLSSG